VSTQAQIHYEDGKSIGVTVRELKADLNNFLQTRLQMLLREIKQKISAIKLAAPMMAIGLVFGLLGLLVLTGALVYVIALGIGIGYSLLIVGCGYLAIAGGAVWIGWAQIAEQGMAPKRTMEVLKQDQEWLRQEARSA
jgi:uncharacterized membrane protein YqjE